MKKVIALMMAGVITISTPMTVVHAESNGEWNLEDELTATGNENENNEDFSDETSMEDLINTSMWIPKEHRSIAKIVF